MHSKRKTSKIWNHFNEILVEEKEVDLVIQKPMASCMYCDDVLFTPGNQGTTHLWNHYYSFHDEVKNLAVKINLEV
jgi:hypothetical protein